MTPQSVGGNFSSEEHNVQLIFVYIELTAPPGERRVQEDAITMPSEAAEGWSDLGFRPMWSVP